MATGDNQICKLVAARGPIQLLRRFNSGSRRQRRVSEEGSSSLKKINLRCGGEDAPPILVGYGGLHSALVRFFNPARTNGRAVTLRD